jgi:hypothetical protein
MSYNNHEQALRLSEVYDLSAFILRGSTSAPQLAHQANKIDDDFDDKHNNFRSFVAQRSPFDIVCATIKDETIG